jgi:hypothetical protein
MTTRIEWNGDREESLALANAIARNCTCHFDDMGALLSTCPPHRMLTEDQRALNGLLFGRRIAERLVWGEFTYDSQPWR